jgi:hypothetical protein
VARLLGSSLANPFHAPAMKGDKGAPLRGTPPSRGRSKWDRQSNAMRARTRVGGWPLVASVMSPGTLTKGESKVKSR